MTQENKKSIKDTWWYSTIYMASCVWCFVGLLWWVWEFIQVWNNGADPAFGAFLFMSALICGAFIKIGEPW